MNTTSHSTIVPPDKLSAQTFASLAVAFAVGGVVSFVLLSLLRLQHAAVASAFIAELLAFVCGILGWRQRSARVVVFTQLAVLAVFAASIVIWISLAA